jgi:hypothetical protein
MSRKSMKLRKTRKTKPPSSSGKRNKPCNFIKKMILKGGGSLDIYSFFTNLGEIKSATLKSILASSLTSDKDLKSDLEFIISSYEKQKEKQLYDFIYVKNQEGHYLLDTIWDNEIGKSKSITGKMHGVHIYVIQNNGRFEIIGKFIR